MRKEKKDLYITTEIYYRFYVLAGESYIEIIAWVHVQRSFHEI